MPPIRIDASQVPPARPRVVQPSPPANFNQDVRRKFGRSREQMVTTKLRVVVQDYPDGPGLYGLQVRVTCKGINSHVAGTTGRDGRFLCELPVRAQSGLTYDVDITWPATWAAKPSANQSHSTLTAPNSRCHFSRNSKQKIRAESTGTVANYR